MKYKRFIWILLAEMLVLIVLLFMPANFGKKAIRFAGEIPTMQRLVVTNTVFGEAGQKQVEGVFKEYESLQAQKHTDLETYFSYKIVSCDAKLCVVEVQTEYYIPQTDTAEKQLQLRQTQQIWFFANEEDFAVEVR